MTTPCDVARDLMPLVLDGTASDGSREMLEKHLEECEACKKIYQSMQNDPSPLPERNGSMDEAMRKIRRKRHGRMACRVLLCLALAAALAFTGLFAWKKLGIEYNAKISLDDYRIELAHTEAGECVATYVLKDPTRVYGSNYSVQWQASEGAIVYLYAETTIVPQHTIEKRSYTMNAPARWVDNAMVFTEQKRVIKEIRQGTPDNYRVIYRLGDEVASVSAEYEEYNQLLEQLSALVDTMEQDWATTPNNLTLADAVERQKKINDLQDKVNQLRETVPEWQIQPF